jgi:hypothetical protein
MINIEGNGQKTYDGYGQPNDIDTGIEFPLHQVSAGYFKIVFPHD